MKINIELDKALEETEVLIRAAKMTEEVNGILKKLEEPSVQMISGLRETHWRYWSRRILSAYTRQKEKSMR